MIFSYRTIEKPSEGWYKEKGSKFLAFAYPVTTEDDAKERIEALKKKYFDARHHCFAWIIGAEKSRFRAYDDGEPNHSAGDPILGQIRSRDLTDVMIVVVRYFGGTKLGVGGLVNAYKEAANDALSHAIIIERELYKRVVLEYSYSDTNEVMKLVSNSNASVVDQQFLDNCIMTIDVPLRSMVLFEERVHFLQQVLKVELFSREV